MEYKKFVKKFRLNQSVEILRSQGFPNYLMNFSNKVKTNQVTIKNID